MFAATMTLSALILWVNIGRIHPIPGATMLTEVLTCADPDCTQAMPQMLPYFSPKASDIVPQTVRFRAEFTPNLGPIDLQAIYLPKFAEHLGVRLNGEVLRASDISRRQWAEPVLINVPPALFLDGANTLDLLVTGRPAGGIELYPFFIGSHDALWGAYNMRALIGPSFARFNLAFVAILGTIYLLVWLNRRQDMRYLWLGLSCACAAIILVQFGYGVLWGGYKLWISLSHLSVAFYALFVMKFIRIHVGLDEMRIERTLLLLLIAATLGFTFTGDHFIVSLSLIVNLVTAFSALAALTVFWIHRDRLNQIDFYVIFTCMLVASAIGTHELILTHDPQDAISFHLFHFVPVCMSLVCLWVIASQLIRSLRRYEVLTDSLNDTIAEKTYRLEQSFSRIAEVERREAVDRERNRIMLDLHDGIGGQLVSTLAYMESAGHEDPTLKDALEAALRDLALVLDSLDSHDSLTTLLGMLRTRLEPLLADHGLRFDWRIMDDPVIPEAGPSSNLHLARIVQEAITNVIKHANASTITVYTDARTIMISDDGIGIDPVIAATPSMSGHGLESMRQRSEAIQANFAIEPAEKGTSISLTFNLPDDTALAAQ